MKLYKIQSGVAIQDDARFFLLYDVNWDTFINDDDIFNKMQQIVKTTRATTNSYAIETIGRQLFPPVGNQELWACGVTYLRSKIGRQEESKDAGGGDFYARVYEAERPEVFFKSTPHRIVGQNGRVNIRKDSTWDVPEPELTLVVTSSGKIVGYTIGNDMSSRSIEGENPLYLPQAKTYDGCAGIGPRVFITDKPLDPTTKIQLEIMRNEEIIFDAKVAISQMKRTFEELVSFVYRECSFPHGCLIMTGTGIVPPNDFTLQSADEIMITIDNIGRLTNIVR
jgi:2-dehydro-3-deoxy-D-arabinonate dehydratase